MSSSQSTEPSDPSLVTYINKLKASGDRGTLALLRAALSESEELRIRSWRILARFGGIPASDGTGGGWHKAEVVRMVAGLMTLPNLRDARNGKSFGHACLALLASDERSNFYKAEQSGPVSLRMQQLLAANRRKVCRRFLPLGRRLAKEPMTLDFAMLYRDLLYWGENVKGRWASEFWGGPRDGELPVEVIAETTKP